MDVKDILKDLVSFNTIKDKENKEIMDYIEKYLKKYNFETERVDKCLLAYNSNNPKIGFIGHTDTVNYESWDGDPFTLQEIDNKLVGLGSCDMKGGIASILSVIDKIDLNKNKLALYFTYDEEIDFKGIYQIKHLIKPDNIIIGEPTDNIPIYGTKGILELKIEFYGIKCHSSTPNKGKSAIMETIKFINDLTKFYDNNIKIDIVNDFDIPYTTMNIGMINGGESVNSVPEKCMIIIDFRVVKEEHLKIIQDKIEELLKDYQAKLIIRGSFSPKLNNSDISFLEEVSSKKETKSYVTEGSVIDKNFIILGPGPDTSHQKNEYVLYDKLKKTVELYQTIIEYYNKKN